MWAEWAVLYSSLSSSLDVLLLSSSSLLTRSVACKEWAQAQAQGPRYKYNYNYSTSPPLYSPAILGDVAGGVLTSSHNSKENEIPLFLSLSSSSIASFLFACLLLPVGSLSLVAPIQLQVGIGKRRSFRCLESQVWKQLLE